MRGLNIASQGQPVTATAISYNHVTADVIRGDRTKEDASTSQPDCRMKKDGGWVWGVCGVCACVGGRGECRPSSPLPSFLPPNGFFFPPSSPPLSEQPVFAACQFCDASGCGSDGIKICRHTVDNFRLGISQNPV